MLSIKGKEGKEGKEGKGGGGGFGDSFWNIKRFNFKFYWLFIVFCFHRNIKKHKDKIHTNKKIT